MNENERKQGFVTEYNELVTKWGVKVTGILQQRSYGNKMMQVEVIEVLEFIPDWKPPQEALVNVEEINPETEAASNGHRAKHRTKKEASG